MSNLTHLDEHGHARMVDVGAKHESRRVAVASGQIALSPEALAAVSKGTAPKGDVLAAARIAGIMAAKRTSELIPLCHPLAIESVTLEFAIEESGIRATATAALSGKTGVEMEALTAVSVALLTVYDMIKAVEKTPVIGEIKLVEKRGGKSGDWVRPA